MAATKNFAKLLTSQVGDLVHVAPLGTVLLYSEAILWATPMVQQPVPVTRDRTGQGRPKFLATRLGLRVLPLASQIRALLGLLFL